MKNVKVNKWLFWVPRILTILFILFLALFSLDVFGNGLTFWQTVLALLMHNIPSIVLAIILAISWKYELIGAITFILAGLLYIVLNLITIFRIGFEYQYIISFLLIGFPALLIGILFLISWFKEIK